MTQPNAESPRLAGDPPRELLGEMRMALEAKDWKKLGELLPLKSLWAFQRPMTTDRGLRSLEILFGRARDLHLQVDRIQKAETTDDKAHLSCSCCLMWTEAESWEEHEFEFDAHVGLGFADGDWQVAYFGLTIMTPENVNYVENDAEKAAATPGATAKPGAMTSGVPGDLAGDGHVMVYMPVLVPSHTAKSLFSITEPTDD